MARRFLCDYVHVDRRPCDHIIPIERVGFSLVYVLIYNTWGMGLVTLLRSHYHFGVFNISFG